MSNKQNNTMKNLVKRVMKKRINYNELSKEALVEEANELRIYLERFIEFTGKDYQSLKTLIKDSNLKTKLDFLK